MDNDLVLMPGVMVALQRNDGRVLFMSPVSVAGYAKELFGAARRW